ncbi:MAG: hypothetical protein SGPRY_009869, partial [Prymnesium sp.]
GYATARETGAFPQSLATRLSGEEKGASVFRRHRQADVGVISGGCEAPVRGEERASPRQPASSPRDSWARWHATEFG